MFESSQFKWPGYLVKATSSLPVFCTLAFACSSVIATEVLDIPSITADRVTRDTRSGEVLSLDWIQLSPKGLRARQSGADNKFEYLQNFSQEKLWMLDWSRRILLEVSPEEEVLVDKNGNGGVVEPFVAVVGDEPQSSVLAVEPCIDLVAVKIGLSRWREQAVQVWRCEYAGGELFSKLFYSEMWGLVIREERIDQTTIELSNIKKTEFSTNYFKPPDYFRKTDFHELIIGSPEIDSYSE